MHILPRRWRGLVLYLFLMGMFPVLPVSATQSEVLETDQQPASGPTFALHAIGEQDGGHFYIELAPGMTQELTVVIGNRGDEPLVLRNYTADAITLTNGGFGLESEEATTDAPTTWLDYSAETYELEPMQTVERTFSVTVPTDTPPGVFITGIALQTAEPLNVEGTSVIEQVIRKIIGVSITVPGPIVPTAELGEPFVDGDTANAMVVVPMANSGNVSLEPAGSLTLTNASGDVAVTAPIAMRPVYAGHSTTLEIPIPPEVSAGSYTVSLHLDDGETGWSASRTDTTIMLIAPEAPTAPAPVEITKATVTQMPDPASGSPPQYADVAVEIVNRANPIASARLTMVVERDGDVVEEVILSQSLALLEPTTVVERPYIPASGWQEGSYTFSLVLESVDPNSGVEAVLATLALPDGIVAP